MREPWRIILVAALTIDAAYLGFRLSTGRSLVGAPGMVALVLAVMLAVGGWIAFQNRSATNEMDRLVTQTNATVRALAQRAGLKYDGPPGLSTAERFGEARGTCRGVQVRATVESFTSENMFITISFPRRSLAPDAAKQIRALVDELRNDDEGAQLYVGKSPPWSSSLGLNPIPETDVERLMRALESACQSLETAASSPASRR